MKKILYMHGGSANHGCEALVRTTAELLGGPQNVQLWSLAKWEDEHYGSAKLVEYVLQSEEIKRGSLSYFESLFRRKILHQTDANMKIFLHNTFKNAIAISIGGDNYCYPWSAKQAIELNREIRKSCNLNVLWGCSIDEEAITEEVKKDLEGYDLITAREQITYKILKRINPNTYQVADSAFLLETEAVDLPELLEPNNTVGVNISPLIMKYGIANNKILNNYEKMIEYIMQETKMNICLLPHVVWEGNDDREPCKYLYEKYKDSGRIEMIEDKNCKQLKYIISQCRVFVGARTHATIAAYSTYVPTLVVGYSVKSKGIARDLFGTDDKYVLSVQNLQSENDLKEYFKWMLEHEEEQKAILKNVIPEYKRKAKMGKEYLRERYNGQ